LPPALRATAAWPTCCARWRAACARAARCVEQRGGGDQGGARAPAHGKEGRSEASGHRCAAELQHAAPMRASRLQGIGSADGQAGRQRRGELPEPAAAQHPAPVACRARPQLEAQRQRQDAEPRHTCKPSRLGGGLLAALPSVLVASLRSVRIASAHPQKALGSRSQRACCLLA
jgi:hypothetical protein